MWTRQALSASESRQSRTNQMWTRQSQRSRGTTEILKANTALFAWLAFLAIGGGFLALYYARIGYMPDIDWHSSLTYIAAASFIGGGIGILFSLSLFLPGYMWSEFLICDKVIGERFCFTDRPDNETCVSRIFAHLGRPFTVIVLITHILLMFHVVYYLVGAGLLLATSLGYVSYVVGAVRKARTGKERPTEGTSSSAKRIANRLKDIRRRLFVRIKPWLTPAILTPDHSGLGRDPRVSKYRFWFGLSVLVSQTAMYSLYRIAGSPTGRDQWTLTFICTAIVLISTHVVAAQYSTHPLQARLASLVAAVVLLYAANHFSPLTEQLMGRYGFGPGNEVDILLNDEGVSAVKKLRLVSNGCEKCFPSGICNAQILSQIGTHYLVRLKDGTLLTLPRSSLVSWIRAGSPGRTSAK
jgi:hypothetical protein